MEFDVGGVDKMSNRIIDFHCDVLYKMIYENKLDFTNEKIMDVTLPRLYQGQVGLQVFAIFLEESLLSGPPRFSQLLRCIDLLKERICSLPNITFIRWQEDVNNWERSGKQIGAMLSLEGITCLEGDMVYVRTAFDLGVRFVGLTWNHATWAVDGILEPRQAGFSQQGKQFICECNRLGMILDVSHLNEHAFWELLDLTKCPVFASHSNCTSIFPHPRNLTDQQIRAIIERDGRIGVTFVPAFITDKKTVTIKDLLRHIEHICALGGQRHLILGSDFDGIRDKIVNLEHAGQYKNLLTQLARMYSEQVVQQISHLNALQFLQSYLPTRR